MENTSSKIIDICDAMKDLLIYKNGKYGDSALNPSNVFTREIQKIQLRYAWMIR